MAKPGMVFVSGKGGGMGRLRRKPASAMVSPVTIVIPGASSTADMRGRTTRSIFR